jgi:hypothetical protein
MMEPDFDDDDLIDDYIEDSFEPPPGYEDDYLEEMMMENGGDAAAGTSSGATQTQANTTENSSNRNSERNGASDMIESMQQQEEEEDVDEIAETSANVTQAYDKRREGKKNLYTFERYASHTCTRTGSIVCFQRAIQTLTRGAFFFFCFRFRFFPPDTTKRRTGGEKQVARRPRIRIR